MNNFTFEETNLLCIYNTGVIRQIKCGFIYQIIYACFKNSDYRIAALFTAILSGYLMPRAITQIT